MFLMSKNLVQFRKCIESYLTKTTRQKRCYYISNDYKYDNKNKSINHNFIKKSMGSGNYYYNSNTVVRSFATFPINEIKGKTPGAKRLSRQEKKMLKSVNFNEVAQIFLKRVQNSVQHMKSQNDVFEITPLTSDDLSEVCVDLGKDKGTYVFTANFDEEAIIFQSPRSGTFRYLYDPISDTWRCAIDDHDIIGLFTRDIIRQCVGYPNL